MNKDSNHLISSLAIFAGLAVVLVVANSLITGLYATHGSSDMSAAAVAARIAPVGQLNTGAPIAAAVAVAAAPTAARSGEAVYSATCTACHATGAAGAPIVGNKEAWAPRIATGLDMLLNSALKGKNAMPARGTCTNCSDAELKAAIEYMVSKSQ